MVQFHKVTVDYRCTARPSSSLDSPSGVSRSALETAIATNVQRKASTDCNSVSS